MPPTTAKARYDHLMTLYRTGQYEAAAKGLAGVLRVSPQDANFLHLAGLVAEAQDTVPRAIMMIRRALVARPNWADAEYNLARLLGIQGDYAEARALMEKVAAAMPRMPQAEEALADFCTKSGDLPSAIVHWKKAIALVPSQTEWKGRMTALSRQICDWSEKPTDLANLPPQIAVTLTDDPVIQREAARNTAKSRFQGIETLPPAAWKAHDKLRIGYLSSDFHAHATSYLLAELFSLHDRDRFEIYAYSYGADDKSDIRNRLKREAQHFIDIRKTSPAAAAQRIRDDEIDVLVDLKGYTRGSRMEILARRPAKHQIHWLGYPGTLGTSFIDAFVADQQTVPVHAESFFTERLVRMPNCYQINDRQRPIGPTLPRSAYGLPEGAFVLGSFNQTYKITPEVFEIWCGLLKEIPNAFLWLYESNIYASAKLLEAARAHGVPPGHIVFAEPTDQASHLARYACMDLAIDTFPVGGHTTTSDALWAGTPVVTMIGQSFVSRVAASVLTAAGLAELITANVGSYRDLILSLAQNPARLRQLKRHLKLSRSTLPLFDTPRFVKDWEFTLTQIAVGG